MNDAPYGYHPGTRIPRRGPPIESPDKEGVVCRYCGAGELVWEKHGDRWRLVDEGGNRHVCPDPLPS